MSDVVTLPVFPHLPFSQDERLARIEVQLAQALELLKAKAARPVVVPEKRFLSVAEAARRLGVSRNETMDQLIDTKALRTVVIGDKRKVPASEIDRADREGLPFQKKTIPARPKRVPVSAEAPLVKETLAAMRALKV